MTRLIQHIIEPEYLFLAWQTPNGTLYGRTKRGTTHLTVVGPENCAQPRMKLFF
ncbi:MAG: hypothetical protein HQL94_01230 [Magnetococcales bacterium]|nr:hypothetical protein [Magnetococcales bacterium]MBF0437630.1 hypothetical protein [Magnetococcales bacterium]